MAEDDAFKKEFRYFKRKDPKPDLGLVINFLNPEKFDQVQIVNTLSSPINKHPACNSCLDLGLTSHTTWKIYTLTSHKGFYFIRNPFSRNSQESWIKKCLTLYPRKPSKTNLDIHFKNMDDVWNSQFSEDISEKQYLSKLRWSTFGYHHDWNTKVYSEENQCPFPSCLKNLSRHVATHLGFSLFQPQAAIVHYYQLDSTLAGHVDQSEMDLSAPIVSLSFGQSAVFLLGGLTRNDRPIPVLLQSGDIVVLSGESRLVYHAMPLVIPDFEYKQRIHSEDPETWKPFEDYLRTSRININVRQVNAPIDCESGLK